MAEKGDKWSPSARRRRWVVTITLDDREQHEDHDADDGQESGK